MTIWWCCLQLMLLLLLLRLVLLVPVDELVWSFWRWSNSPVHRCTRGEREVIYTPCVLFLWLNLGRRSKNSLPLVVLMCVCVWIFAVIWYYEWNLVTFASLLVWKFDSLFFIPFSLCHLLNVNWPGVEKIFILCVYWCECTRNIQSGCSEEEITAAKWLEEPPASAELD